MTVGFPFIAASPWKSRGASRDGRDYSDCRTRATKRKSHALRVRFGGATGSEASGRAGGDGDAERERGDGFVEDCAGEVGAAAAAVRAAGTPLQFRERTRAVGRGFADGVVGYGVADADVHERHPVGTGAFQCK